MEPAALSQQYYVGQNGDQTGPYSETDIISQIQQGLIQPDALVWHEGMPEWQPIRNFDRFSEAFSGAGHGEIGMDGSVSDLSGEEPWETSGPGPAMSNPKADEEAEEKKQSVSKKGLKKFRHSEVSTFAFSDKEAKPIYKDNMFRATAKYIKRRFSMVFFGGILFAVGYGGYQFFISVISPEDGGESVAEVPKKRGRGFPKGRGTANTTTPNSAGGTGKSAAIPIIDGSVRASELQKAKSDMLLNSEGSMQVIERLVEANPEDATGKEALETGVLYYKTNQRRTEAGRLLMKAKKPLEASKYFLEEPAQWEMAEQALYTAYQQSRAADRADILIQDINILLGPLGRPEVARDRIKQLEKDFPRRKHPFAYYLKSIDGRIADIFNRLSFYFVQNLLSHVAAEFAAMTWTERPVVEILRLRDGKYRIVGRYKGDVILSRDKLNNITFVFWMEGDTWRLVETDVTDERGRFAASEKERLKTRSVLAAQMLENLENRFRTKFPKARLHEAVSEGADDTRRPAVE